MSSLMRWAAIAVLVLGVLLAGAWSSGWTEARSWPIRWLEVNGDIERVATAQIRAAVAEHARRGFFAVDVDGARAAVESLPWVRRASVARQWPDALSITVVEQQAVARFNGDALVNAEGELFRVAGTATMQGLVDLAGPTDRHRQVVERWREIGRLLQPHGVSVSRVEMDPRGSWRVVLADGLELLLGRDQIEPRLRRFLAVRPELIQRGPLVRVDLRYPNGLSVTPRAVDAEADAERWAGRRRIPVSGVDPNHG